MPEGDTIVRTAAGLARVLVGRAVTGFASRAVAVAPGAVGAQVPGRVVADVVPRGKHLLMVLREPEGVGDPVRAAPEGAIAPELRPEDLMLHTHLGLHGAWHLYRPGETWQRAPSRASVVVETAGWIAPCFQAAVAELLTPRDLARHPVLAALGPDAAAEWFDADAVRARLRRTPEREIGVALLDQGTVAGFGNVYKSEALFVARVSPFARVGALDDATLDRVIRTARELLRANLTGPRRTRRALNPRESVWVYGRSGAPCRACGTTVAVRRQGPAARPTYFCPRCQPSPTG